MINTRTVQARLCRRNTSFFKNFLSCNVKEMPIGEFQRKMLNAQCSNSLICMRFALGNQSFSKLAGPRDMIKLICSITDASFCTGESEQ